MKGKKGIAMCWLLFELRIIKKNGELHVEHPYTLLLKTQDTLKVELSQIAGINWDCPGQIGR